MLVLRRAWQIIVRRFTETDAGAANTQPSDVQSHHLSGDALRAAVRRLHRYWQQIKRRWQAHWRRNALERRAAEQTKKLIRRSERRALVLLLRQLNYVQRQEFRIYRYFHVVGGSSGGLYRIRTSATANIDVLLPDGRVKWRLCAGPVGVPVYAAMTGQLLHLQDPASEEQFLQRANIHPVYPDLPGNQV